jgi:signal peptidase I
MKKRTENIVLLIIGILLGVLLVLGTNLIIKGSPTITGNAIFNSPNNWLTEESIQLKDDQIIINVNNSKIISYSDVKSMEPYVNENALSIILNPKIQELEIGDVIIFRKNGILITHRIILIGNDNSGRYFLTQGDNNEISDGKIRFEQIEGVVAGILY